MTAQTLPRPIGLPDDQWKAICEAHERLMRAREVGDVPLIIGCAKELCESVAKVVVTQRGGVPPAQMSKLIARAHSLLEFQPGEGLATDGATRQLAQGLKDIVLGLSEMRNKFGTGHGRATPSPSVSEHAELAESAALAWARWALRRLEGYIAADPTQLVHDLQSAIFHRGELAERLTLANLPKLTPDQQRQIGLAVGRRASRGTFVVCREGIEKVDPTDRSRWPTEYIRGVLLGMWFDEEGTLNVEPWKVHETRRIAAGMDDPCSVLSELAEVARSSHRPSWPDEEDRAVKLRRAFDEASDRLDDRASAIWRDLRDIATGATQSL